jgi:protein pelota
MRLLKSQIEQKTGAGFATFLPEEPEDMVSMGIRYCGYC